MTERVTACPCLKYRNQTGLGPFPKCGAEIQATREVYYSEVTLNGDGDVADDDATGRPLMREASVEGDTRIYCANDHTHDEIIAALARVQKN